MHDPLETRLRVLDAEPDSCSLTMGTTNFGDDVFLNPWPFVCELYQLSQEREVVPEFELFDLGQVHALHRLLDTYGLPYGGKVHGDLVMGVPGGMHGTADALVAARRRAAGRGRPRGRPPASAARRSPVMLAVAVQGRPPAGRHGGRADPRRGVPVEHNAQLVERASPSARWRTHPMPPTRPGAAGVKVATARD